VASCHGQFWQHTTKETTAAMIKRQGKQNCFDWSSVERKWWNRIIGYISEFRAQNNVKSDKWFCNGKHDGIESIRRGKTKRPAADDDNEMVDGTAVIFLALILGDDSTALMLFRPTR
jgi:hypothetical protein